MLHQQASDRWPAREALPEERSSTSDLNQEVHSRDREDWSTREEFGSVRWTTAVRPDRASHSCSSIGRMERLSSVQQALGTCRD